LEKVGENLVGSKFTLTSFREDHVTPQYIGWLNNSEVNKYLDVRFVHQTHETGLTFVRSFYGDEEKYIWGISSKGDDSPIGTATLYCIDNHHRSGVIGLLIGKPEYWGEGASNEAMELILNFAFKTLGLHRVMGGSNSLNFGMNFTFKRLGFTLEGKLREACYLGGGEYSDDYRWGLLKHVWDSQRQSANSSDE
jgi:ribosomal-protein-alanine N-acetyltransferase